MIDSCHEFSSQDTNTPIVYLLAKNSGASVFFLLMAGDIFVGLDAVAVDVFVTVDIISL